MRRTRPFDFAAYAAHISTRPCFICGIVAGQGQPHEVVYEDDIALAFLNRFPTLYGYLLVAPREHREQVTTDFTLEEYLALQEVVYRVAEALSQEVPTERMYILSLGSQQGNRHVHWHIAPLPHGVPFEEQQLDALDARRGLLEISDEEMAELAARLRRRLQVPGEVAP